MIDESKFPEYREKVFQYIQEEILPKYPEIKSCVLHVLSFEINRDSELIFFTQYKLDEIQRKNLENLISREIFHFCQGICKWYWLKLLIVIKS